MIIDNNIPIDGAGISWIIDPHFEYKKSLFANLEGVFTNQECDLIVDYNLNKHKDRLEKAKIFVKSAEENPLDRSIRESMISFMPNDDPEMKWLFQKMTDVVNNVNEKAFGYDLIALETLQFTHYNSKTKGFYTRHTDISDGLLSRKLSCTLQLTDGDSYEGGNLLLHNSPEPDIVSRKKGSIVFFPSYVLHEVTPVTKGERNSLVSWVAGPRFK